jgi:hypothetical protein
MLRDRLLNIVFMHLLLLHLLLLSILFLLGHHHLLFLVKHLLLIFLACQVLFVILLHPLHVLLLVVSWSDHAVVMLVHMVVFFHVLLHRHLLLFTLSCLLSFFEEGHIELKLKLE